MKVGDYVRFKDKRGNTYIRKVIDGYKAHWYGCKVDKEANNVPYVSAKNIIKSSPNIIDLIEVGDYVNGSRVEEIEEYNGEKYLYLEEMEYSNANQDYINVYCKQEYIKSIVTKEAFESMEYRIGE